MIEHTELDLAALDVVALEAVQRSAQRVIAEIEPYLERLQSGRNDLQAFQLDEWLFHAVGLVKGILVDPALPIEYDETNHLQHYGEQRARWRGRPFIKRTTWNGQYGLKAYELAVKAALARFSPTLGGGQPIEALRARWFTAWPSGIRYEVSCLDGSDLDRAISWGTFATMAEALDCAVNRWRQ